MTYSSVRCLPCYQSKAGAFKTIVPNSNVLAPEVGQMKHVAHLKIGHISLPASAGCLFDRMR
jgi:hypothetical protein